MARKGINQADAAEAVAMLDSGRQQRTCPTCAGTYGPAPSDRQRHLNTKTHTAAAAEAVRQDTTASLATPEPAPVAVPTMADIPLARPAAADVPEGYFLTTTGKVRRVPQGPRVRPTVADGRDRYAIARQAVTDYLVRASAGDGAPMSVFHGQDVTEFRRLLVEVGGEQGAALAATSDGNVRTHRRIIRRDLEGRGIRG